MSAIFGVYNLNKKPISSKVLEEMSAVLSHRGMDDSGVWNEAATGLGHRMLKTTPEAENEKLPFVSKDKSLVITADARLDNRKELIDLLGPFDESGSPVSDSELILAAYQKWGESCAERLLGDFAFGIWDLRKQQVFCARDHFGVKPFYYHLSENLFAFATEIKGLLVLPEISECVNEIRVAEHLANTLDYKEMTFYRDVLRLLPGHCAVINRESKRIFSYWKLELPPELKLKSDGEYAEALRELFTEAVDCRLRSSVPVGTMLSGGMDSSSITCMARKLLASDKTAQLHTFSGVFDHVKECDEREYINTVIRENSISPHFIVADSHGPYADIDDVLKIQDEPMTSSNVYVNWLSYKAAKAKGVKVILDGYDGDTTISHGLGYFTELGYEKRWVKLISENIAYARRTGQPWRRSAWSWIWNFGLNPWITKNKYASRVHNGMQRVKAMTAAKPEAVFEGGAELNADFAQRVNSALLDKKKNIKLRTERDIHFWNLTDNGSHFSPLEILDYASGVFSVEMRYPFWDKRMIEFCLSLPPEQKIKKGWTRMIMRRAMDGILPREIQWRPGKTDQTAGYNYGLLKFGREIINDVIIKNPEAIVDYVNIESLREAHERFLRSEATLNDVLSIQHCVSLALWLQTKSKCSQ